MKKQSQLPPGFSDQGRQERPSRRPRVSVLTAGIALLVAGLIFGVSAATVRGQNQRTDLSLIEFAQKQEDLVTGLEEAVDGLQVAIDNAVEKDDPKIREVEAPITQPLTGPGLVVSLDDAPADFSLDPQLNPNEVIVHQQDVDAVLNALWRAGAEGIAVQDVRLTSSTPVRCVGSVILVGTRSYSPPYLIAAVGNVDAMQAELDSDSSVALYREAASRYQMGWDVTVHAEMTVPGASSPAAAKYAFPVTQEAS